MKRKRFDIEKQESVGSKHLHGVIRALRLSYSNIGVDRLDIEKET